VVAGLLSLSEGYDFDWAGGVMWTQNQAVVHKLDVFYVCKPVLPHGNTCSFRLCGRNQGIVVAVEQQDSTGRDSGMHAHALLRIRFDHHETFPSGAARFRRHFSKEV